MVQTLLKMVEAALTSKAGVKWGHVLHYLDSHCQEDFSRSNIKLPYQSPLPAFFVATQDLAKQLKADPITGESVLRTALKGAPARVVAALCQLGPHALEATDHRGRLPLHLACRRTEEDPETEKVMTILVDAFPLALMHRDDGGRTPLHWIFWYQAEHRSPTLVGRFCQVLPKAKFYTLKQHHDADKKYPLPEIPRPSATNKVPHNASIIPDARLGCLPLHYAIMEGASSLVIQTLIQAYPLSKHMSDRFGRTACHWYLGAGYLRSGCSHVSGEARDPNSAEWWDRTLSLEKLRLLLSSRVARTADCLNRHPLHWASELLACNFFHGKPEMRGKCLSLAGVQVLLDHHIGQLTCCDHKSQTPLMVMLDTVARLQDRQWKRNGGQLPVVDRARGGPSSFDPPLDLMFMLLTFPDPTSETRPGSIEDDHGRLPIHVALSIAASPAIVELLIQANPVALVHTTEETLQAPLHAAFSRPCTAALQSVETIELVLRTYTAEKNGMSVDGRMCMKMEDAAGSYPIHYACQNKACVEIIKLLVDKYPMTALALNSDGDLPIHCLLENSMVKAVTTSTIPGEQETKDEFSKEDVEAARQKMAILIPPLLSNVAKLQVSSSKHGMMPLHVAVLFEAVPYATLLRALEMYPDAALQFTSHPDGSAFSVLDLHEFRKAKSDDELEDWKRIRELLFSFTPTLESHRHREELLDQCVRIVVNEMNGDGSYHLSVPKLPVATPLLSQSLLPAKEPPVVLPSTSMVSKTSASRRKMSRLPPKRKQKASAKAADQKKDVPANATGESMYDDTEMTLGDYMASGSEEEDDSSFSEEEEEEESGTDEYYSDQLDDDTYDDGYTYNPSLDNESTFGGSSIYDQCSISFSASGTSYTPQHTRTMSSGVKTVPSNAFDDAIEKAEEEEKEEAEDPEEVAANVSMLSLSNAPVPLPSCPKFLSEVGLRLWTFFVLYSDTQNPSDNYVKQVADIFDQISFSNVGRLVAVTLPTCASLYLPEDTNLTGLSFRDIASPKCRELIHKTCYFVGKYDFRLDNAESRLIHRSSDGKIVVVRASEWLFTTEETTDAASPGMSEAEIWATGERPAEMGLTFRSRQRNVWIKFTKDANVYKNEIETRIELGVPVEGDAEDACVVAPLLSHYNAFSTDRKADRSYTIDINDARFSDLELFAGMDDTIIRDSVCLKEFPYALVYATSGHGTLADYYRQHGMSSTTQIKRVGLQISEALKVMHAKGIIHTNVSMQNVTFLNGGEGSPGQWVLTDVAQCCRVADVTHSLGRITSKGFAQFSTGALPPEAFIKVSPTDVKAYEKYWTAVERDFGVQVNSNAVGPMVDFETGETFAVRCYFDSEGATPMPNAAGLPPLPYALLPACESVDVWGLGLLMFRLCAGRPLFPVSTRDSELLDFAGMCDWDSKMAASLIHKYVADPLAQDLLFMLLSPCEERKAVTLGRVTSHPFFSCADTSPPWIRHIIQRRKQETSAHFRRLQNKAFQMSDKVWLEEKTVSINCWDFEVLSRIHLSPTEIIRGMAKTKEIATPCSFVLLPYRLCHNKNSLLTPSTKTDIELAERMGAGLLDISKACHFANAMKQAITSGKKSSSMWWSSSEVLRVLALSSDDFGDVQAEMVELAARHVESFRDNPMTVAQMVIQKRVERVLSCFDGAPVFLYLVDDFNGVPVIDEASGSPYPLEVSGERREEILQRGILLMHLCCLYARGVTGDVSGLVKLIFEAADPHVPPSWIQASSGLKHELDEAAIVAELRTLQGALGEMFSTRHRIYDDSLAAIRNYLSDVDPKRDVAGMRRVVSGGACLWTTFNGVQELKGSTQSFTFRDALRQRSKTTATLVSQEPSEFVQKAASQEVELVQKAASQEVEEPVRDVPSIGPAESLLDAESPDGSVVVSALEEVGEKMGITASQELDELVQKVASPRADAVVPVGIPKVASLEPDENVQKAASRERDENLKKVASLETVESLLKASSSVERTETSKTATQQERDGSLLKAVSQDVDESHQSHLFRMECKTSPTDEQEEEPLRKVGSIGFQ